MANDIAEMLDTIARNSASHASYREMLRKRLRMLGEQSVVLLQSESAQPLLSIGISGDNLPLVEVKQISLDKLVITVAEDLLTFQIKPTGEFTATSLPVGDEDTPILLDGREIIGLEEQVDQSQRTSIGFIVPPRDNRGRASVDIASVLRSRVEIAMKRVERWTLAAQRAAGQDPLR